MLALDWAAPPGVRAACSTRNGGVSSVPYDSLNLGDHVGDDPGKVEENRRRFAANLGVRPVFLRQVHGIGVVRLDAATPDAIEADACWTTGRGIACTMMVADCLPVLLADGAGAVVGAAHCGWRGLAGGVLEALCAQMKGPGRASELVAWLGPCIGRYAFEVGPEVRDAFAAPDPGAAAFFLPHASEGKLLANLQGLARRRLQALGVTQVAGNDGGAAWCTVANPSRFFSHRRDRVSGRFAAAAWLA